jgi:hypothetical protein
MKVFFVLFATIVVIASIVDDINNDPTSTWWAKEYPSESLEKIRASLIHPLKTHEYANKVQNLIKADESFDARDKWGDLLYPVNDYNQACGLWAYLIAEVVSERVAIAGTPLNRYSSQDLVICDPDSAGYECQGPDVELSWNYILVSGLALDSCIPYQIASCPTKCVDGSDIVRKKATKIYPLSYDRFNFY